MEEFFAQGDREKELGIVPIAMHDRERASAAQSQVGFIEFVVGPLCAGVIRMFPPLAELGVHLVEVRTTLCTRRLELSPRTRARTPHWELTRHSSRCCPCHCNRTERSTRACGLSPCRRRSAPRRHRRMLSARPSSRPDLRRTTRPRRNHRIAHRCPLRLRSRVRTPMLACCSACAMASDRRS